MFVEWLTVRSWTWRLLLHPHLPIHIQSHSKLCKPVQWTWSPVEVNLKEWMLAMGRSRGEDAFMSTRKYDNHWYQDMLTYISCAVI